MLGIVFLTVGFRIYSLLKKNLKSEQRDEKEYKFPTSGIYRIVRHPDYLAWLFIFIGSTFILDSFIGLILIPPIIILIEVNGVLKEKYVLIPKYGEVYERYKEETPNRILSPPYNSLLFIIAIFIVYIGFLNFEYIFNNLSGVNQCI
jgi:protein-S-isoprenylcysteine O-methyltransferase Ste14